MEKLDIIKIQSRTEEIWKELIKKYPDDIEIQEDLKQYFTKLLILLHKITIKEVSGEENGSNETP
jgi:hypothetical protein